MENLTEDSDFAITSLAVSQAIALEFNDRKIVEGNRVPEILQVTTIPDNYGTNACSFLSLGIVNHFTKILVESIIIDFSKNFNIYRDKNMPVDVYEAYNILSKNEWLDFYFEFFEYLVDNDPIYSIHFQKKTIEALPTLQN